MFLKSIMDSTKIKHSYPESLNWSATSLNITQQAKGP